MVNRFDPQLPPSAMKTYELRSPLATHWRPATCAEVDCAAQAHGWRTVIDVATDLGRVQANYIRLHSGRHFTAEETGTLVTFTFPAGQTCFAEHRAPLDRPEFYRVVGGDWRGNPRGEVYNHANAADWVDDFRNHQDKLATEAQKG